jgi:hypothetical protein
MKQDIKDRQIYNAALYKRHGAPHDFDFDAVDTCIRGLSREQAASLWQMVNADPRAVFESVLVPSEVVSMVHRSPSESADMCISSIEGSSLAGMNRMRGQVGNLATTSTDDGADVTNGKSVEAVYQSVTNEDEEDLHSMNPKDEGLVIEK